MARPKWGSCGAVCEIALGSSVWKTAILFCDLARKKQQQQQRAALAKTKPSTRILKRSLASSLAKTPQVLASLAISAQ
jgi:hypothetical protein